MATLNLSIDADTLTVGDIESLENAKTIGAIVSWLVKNAGADVEALRALPARDLRHAMDGIRQQMAEAFAIPKANVGE